MIPADFRNPESVREFVRNCFADSPARLAHVEMIADLVRESAEKLIPEDTELAECAALLHDIGYWGPIARLGFHPVDGANYLTERGEQEIARLIIGHSCSPEEGELRGFSGIVQDESLIARLITYYDVKVMQGGRLVSYQERLEDILSRYGKDSLIGRANLAAAPRILKILEGVDRLL